MDIWFRTTQTGKLLAPFHELLFLNLWPYDSTHQFYSTGWSEKLLEVATMRNQSGHQQHHIFKLNTQWNFVNIYIYLFQSYSYKKSSFVHRWARLIPDCPDSPHCTNQVCVVPMGYSSSIIILPCATTCTSAYNFKHFVHTVNCFVSLW